MAKRKAAEPQTPGGESFEDSLTELQSIVSELEDGELGLEASLARFERGVGLLRKCHVILDSTEQKIETLTRFDDVVPPAAPSLERDDSLEREDNSVESDDETNPRLDTTAAPDPNVTKSSLF